MRVHFQPLGRCPELRRVLGADGWTLEGLPDDALLADHPGVADEEAARSRLLRLGLLTSGRFRIEFLAAGVSPLGKPPATLRRARAVPLRLTPSGPR